MNEASSLLPKEESNQAPRRRPTALNFWSFGWIGLGVAIGVMISLHRNGSLWSAVEHTASLRKTTTPRYSHFQTLGFQVYTGGAPVFLEEYDNATGTNVTFKNHECEGRHSHGVLGGWEHMCYIGLDDPIEDVEQRLSIMKDAVEKAYQVSRKNSSTLKIFVAPEFYFRGVEGAYLFQQDFGRENCGAICHTLQGLEDLVADARFADWLFVFGTVIAYDSLPTATDDGDYVYYNFAPVYRGYDPAKTDHHGKRFLVPKRYVSNIDFLTPRRSFSDNLLKELVDEPTTPLDHDGTVDNPIDFHQYFYGQSLWPEYKQELTELDYTTIEYGWMIVDGITLTLEICFDHKQRTALTSYLADIVTGSTTRIPKSTFGSRHLEFVSIPRNQAQISLVASAGMQVKPDSLALADKGTIFLQDGLTDDDSVMMTEATAFGCHTASETCLEFDGGTEAVRRRAVLTKSDVFFEHELLSSFDKHSIYGTPGEWAEKLNGIFSVKMYEAMIAAYDPAKIAYVSTEELS